jgi:hypothetical protein
MQDAPDEHNRGFALLVGLAAVVAALVAVAVPRIDGAPTPAECCEGDDAAWTRRAVWLGFAGLAGGTVLATATFAPALRRQGRFAMVLAAFAAAGLTACAGLCWPAPRHYGSDLIAVAAAGAAAAVGVGCGALPWCKERGLLSLAVIPALTGLPWLLALRAVRAEANEVAPLRSVLAALRGATGPAVGFAVPEGIDPDLERAVPWCAQPPFRVPGIAVYAAPAGTPAAAWFEAMGLPVLTVAAGQFELRPAALRTRPPLLQVTARLPPPGDPYVAGEVLVDAGPRCANGVATVFTAFGVVETSLDAEGKGRLAEGERARLQSWRTPPADKLPIRILAVSPLASDAYGCTDIVPDSTRR